MTGVYFALCHYLILLPLDILNFCGYNRKYKGCCQQTVDPR